MKQWIKQKFAVIKYKNEEDTISKNNKAYNILSTNSCI